MTPGATVIWRQGDVQTGGGVIVHNAREPHQNAPGCPIITSVEIRSGMHNKLWSRRLGDIREYGGLLRHSAADCMATVPTTAAQRSPEDSRRGRRRTGGGCPVGRTAA